MLKVIEQIIDPEERTPAHFSQTAWGLALVHLLLPF